MIKDVLGNLLKSLQSHTESVALYVTSGACDSYDDYRFHAGFLEGLQMAAELITTETEKIEIGKLSPHQTRVP